MNRVRSRLTGLRSRHPRSFTLIEVLVALTLTTLLFSVAGQVAINALKTRATVRESIAVLEREAVVFEQIATDLANLLRGFPGKKTPIRVFGYPKQVLEIDTLAPVFGLEESLHLVRVPATVRYRLLRHDLDADGFDLVREVIGRTSTAKGLVRETLAAGMTSLGVQVHYDNQWINTYPPADKPQRDPAALRISFRWLETTQTATRTFLVRDGG